MTKNRYHLVLTDSSAPRGMAYRLGVGQVKHLSIKVLFVQELIKDGVLAVKKISGDLNKADLGTKFHDRKRHWELLRMLNFVGQ